jgi:2-methylcitrate dehydratase
MLEPVRETQHPTDGASLVLAVAHYAATFTVDGETALAAARWCVIDALRRGFEALRIPECASRVRPLVPGALMPGGARVPGTSLELEPAQAAYCIGVMLSRPEEADHWPGSSRPRRTDPLAAILAAADYRARRCIMEGKAPPMVRDILAAMVKALEIQSALAAPDADNGASGKAPLRGARVMASAVAAALLGGTSGQIARAAMHASLDGDLHVPADDRHPFGHWAVADTLGRAVRHACEATAPGSPSSLTAVDLAILDLADSVLGARPAMAGPPSRSPRRLGTEHIDRLGSLRRPSDLAQLMMGFRAAVDGCFPPRQSERIKALFAAPERLDDMPVNELMAALVANGAR